MWFLSSGSRDFVPCTSESGLTPYQNLKLMHMAEKFLPYTRKNLKPLTACCKFCIGAIWERSKMLVLRQKWGNTLSAVLSTKVWHDSQEFPVPMFSFCIYLKIRVSFLFRYKILRKRSGRLKSGAFAKETKGKGKSCFSPNPPSIPAQNYNGFEWTYYKKLA